MQDMQTKSQATMSAIADAADVSISTVSRVLAGGQGISKLTIQKVQKQATALGYKPKPATISRSQNRGKNASLHIGLLHTSLDHYLPEKSIQTYLHQKFIMETWQAVHDLGHTLCMDYLNLDQPSDRSNLLSLNNLDGVIVKGTITPEFLNMIPDNLPAVVLRLPMGMICKHTSVNCNYGTGISRCVQHLCDLGHQRIGFFCLGNQRLDNMDKITAYQQTLKLNGLDEETYLMTPLLDQSGDSEQPCALAEEQWFKQDNPPTAIISSETFCNTFANLLNKRGLEVPKDVSLIDAVTGASTDKTSQEHYTRLQMPAKEMCQATVEHLIRHIQNPDAPPQTVLMEMDFTPGDTTAPPPPGTPGSFPCSQ